MVHEPPVLLDSDLRQVARDLFGVLTDPVKITRWYERQRIDTSAIGAMGAGMAEKYNSAPEIPPEEFIAGIACLCFAIGWESHRQVRGERSRDGLL